MKLKPEACVGSIDSYQRSAGCRDVTKRTAFKEDLVIIFGRQLASSVKTRTQFEPVPGGKDFSYQYRLYIPFEEIVFKAIENTIAEQTVITGSEAASRYRRDRLYRQRQIRADRKQFQSNKIVLVWTTRPVGEL